MSKIKEVAYLVAIFGLIAAVIILSGRGCKDCPKCPEVITKNETVIGGKDSVSTPVPVSVTPVDSLFYSKAKRSRKANGINWTFENPAAGTDSISAADYFVELETEAAPSDSVYSYNDMLYMVDTSKGKKDTLGFVNLKEKSKGRIFDRSWPWSIYKQTSVVNIEPEKQKGKIYAGFSIIGNRSQPFSGATFKTAYQPGNRSFIVIGGGGAFNNQFFFEGGLLVPLNFKRK